MPSLHSRSPETQKMQKTTIQSFYSYLFHQVTQNIQISNAKMGSIKLATFHGECGIVC